MVERIVLHMTTMPTHIVVSTKKEEVAKIVTVEHIQPAPKYILYFGADFFLHTPARWMDENFYETNKLIPID